MKNIKDIILTRRSIRRFSNKPIENITEILDVARWAPTHCNTQRVKFIIVTDDKLKQKIVDRGGSIIVKDSRYGILVLYDATSDNIEYKDHIQSGAAIIQNLCLYAHSKGLGSCWVCHLPRKQDLKKLFKIPKFYDIIAYVIIGHPLKKPTPIPRKNKIEEIISFNEFKFGEEKHKNLFVRTVLRKMYYYLPTSVKRIINPWVDKKFVKKFEN